MCYLIAIDSDGTLRRSDGTIGIRSKIIMKCLREKGHVVVICTARPRYHTLKISKEVYASPYLISSNGTEVYDAFSNQIVYQTFLSKSCCKRILNDTLRLGLRSLFVCENTEYCTQFTRNENQILLNDHNYQELFSQKVKQIMIIGKQKELIKEYKEKIKNVYHFNIVDASSSGEEAWFSIISKRASKGIALEKLASYLKIPMKNTIAIGNDNNDLSMFEKANFSVAVANAIDSVKEKASTTTLSNDEDGVAVFLETLL